MKIAVFDIGGNGVQYWLDNRKIKSFSTFGKDREFVIEQISRIINDNNVKNVAIASPCGVNPDEGFLYGISGIKNYGNFNLYEAIRKKVNHDIFIIAHNDGNAALLGNVEGENISSAIQFTIGTGIGGGIYLNNQIFTGVDGMAGEFGYAPLSDYKIQSEAGSASALIEMINQNKNTSFKNFHEVKAKNIEFSDVLDRWSTQLSRIILQAFFSLAPELIFIDGGITHHTTIKNAINNKLKKLMAIYDYDFKVQIKFKELSNPALIGMTKLLERKIVLKQG